MSRRSHRRRYLAAALILCPAALLPIRAEAEAGAAKERVVTVFSNGLGQVWEHRALTPAAGPRDIVLDGISKRALAESVSLAGSAGDLTVRSISLDTNLLTPDRLLKAYLGKQVEVIKAHPTTGEERIVPATVVSLAGGVVLRMDGRLVTGMPGRLAFPDDTQGMVTSPTLTASIEAGAGTDGLLLSYMTDGLDWRADYTATLAADGKAMRIEAWATVENGTGVDLDAGRLRLVAGQVNRPPQPRPLAKTMRMTAGPEAAMDAAGAMPLREAVGAVHVYTVAGAVNLPAEGRKQLALLAPVTVPVTETLIATGNPPVFGPQRGEIAVEHPEVRLSFANTALVPGGLPLPAGTLRVYRVGGEGPPLFSGADQLPDTPDGEVAEISLGRAFDVTLRREQTAFKRLDAQGRNVEAAFRIELKNGRAGPARVRLEENLPGDWTVAEASQPHSRDGGRAVWTVEVPAKGSKVLTYKVRVAR